MFKAGGLVERDGAIGHVFEGFDVFDEGVFIQLEGLAGALWTVEGFLNAHRVAFGFRASSMAQTLNAAESARGLAGNGEKGRSQCKSAGQRLRKKSPKPKSSGPTTYQRRDSGDEREALFPVNVDGTPGRIEDQRPVSAPSGCFHLRRELVVSRLLGLNDHHGQRRPGAGADRCGGHAHPDTVGGAV